MIDVEIDYHNLQQLFVELEPKRRLQALKSAYRKEATRVRKVAIKNLRSSGLRNSKDLEKGIRKRLLKKKVGIQVTVGTKKANKRGKGESGFHTNRFGQKKPILLWAELGTVERKTKSGGGIFSVFRRRAARKRKSHRTGRMRRYGFMEKTNLEVRDTVTNNIRNNIVESAIKISQKYGCK